MYNQPFYIPSSYYGIVPGAINGGINNLARSAMIPGGVAKGATNYLGTYGHSGGLFSKLGGIFGSVKSFNWSGLINNTSKTLGIVNQAIPLVRQVGPMVGNMRSMLRLASVFKDETDNGIKNTSNNLVKNNISVSNNSNIIDSNSNVNNLKKEETLSVNNSSTDVSPTFFVN